MKAFHNEVRDRSGIPCEGNCPYLVVTDTLNGRKDSEGVVDTWKKSEIQANVRFGRKKKGKSGELEWDRTHDQ